MIPYDMNADLGFVLAEPPVTQTNSDTALVSSIVDMVDYVSGMFVIMTGAVTDTNVTSTVLLEHGDDSGLSDAAGVDDADMLPAGTGQEAAAAPAAASDNTVTSIGYAGTKRYLRLTITPSGNNSGDLPIAVLFIGKKRFRGTGN
jgi:hypothetical protein